MKKFTNALIVLALILTGALLAITGDTIKSARAQQSFRIYPDALKGYPTYIRGAPSYVDVRVLGAAANEDHTVPAGANAVIFSSNCAAFYAKIGGTAAVPAADVTNGSGSELNPAAWYVGSATTIGLISPGACIITMSWYNVTP